MSSTGSAGGLFSGMFERGESAAQVTERALLDAMIDAELALVQALVTAGIAPQQAADDLEQIDRGELPIAELGHSTADKGTPVPALVSSLRAQLGERAGAGWVHAGATSQDIIDTALMLVTRRALVPLLGDLGAAADRCAELAREHRSSLQAGRTLLQQAVPLTFGLKAAGWMSALDDAGAELRRVRDGLPVQLGGAAGTLAAYGERGLDVIAAFAAELGLREPAIPWHTNRLLPGRLAGALGLVLGAIGKVARDVTLLAQTEVGELSEGGAGRGGSSAMPHKRNPVAAITVLACAQRGPGLVATILASMIQEHERAAGAWQAEWEPLLELLRLAGSAADAQRELLDGLELDRERMRANLELTNGLVMSESVIAAGSEPLGRARASELVAEAAARAARERRPLRDVLLEEPGLAGALDQAALDRALAPEGYLGVTGSLIDRALAAHAQRA